MRVLIGRFIWETDEQVGEHAVVKPVPGYSSLSLLASQLLFIKGDV